MRIVVDAVGIRDGGGRNLLQTYLAALPDVRPAWRWEVYVSAGSGLEPIPADDGPVRIVPIRARGWSARMWWLNRRLPALARRTGADALFCFANLAPLRRSLPTLVLLQQARLLEPGRYAGPADRLRMAVLRAYFRLQLRSADRIIVQSGAMREMLTAHAPDVTDRVDVMPSPVARVESGPPNAAIAAAAERGGPRLLYVSHPRAHKNYGALIEALGLVRRRLPTAQLLLTVAGPSSSPSDAECALHRLAERFGVADGVAWLGSLSPGEVAQVHRMADLVVFPSLQESFGLPLAEALVYGVPAAASDRGFAHEILGDAGVFFDPLDPRGIAGALLEVLEAPARRAELAERARRRASLFDARPAAERLCRTLETLAGAEAS